MSGRNTDAPIVDFLGEGITVPANSGNPLCVPTRQGYTEVLLYDYEATPVGFRMKMAPALTIYFYDDSAGTYTKLDAGVTDGNQTGSTGTTLDSWAVADYLYVGAARKFGGIKVDILDGSPNATASVMTMGYSKSDGTFAAQAITDGTANGGATVGQDGDISLDAIPTDWTPQKIGDILSSDVRTLPSERLYWVRFDVSVALDSDTEISNIYPYSEDYGSATGGFFQGATEYSFDIDPATTGALCFLSQDTGTEATDVTWIKR